VGAAAGGHELGVPVSDRPSTAVSSVTGARLRVMDPLNRTPATPPEFPLTEYGRALRDETLRQLAGLPFPPDAPIKRSACGR